MTYQYTDTTPEQPDSIKNSSVTVHEYTDIIIYESTNAPIP